MNEEDWEELKHLCERFACFAVGVIVTLFMLALLNSCCPCKHLSTTSTTVRDSIVIHDSIVVVKLDTVRIDVPTESNADIALPTDTAKAATSISAAWSWLEDGRIMLKLWNFGSLPAVVPKTTVTIKDQQISSNNSNKTEIVEVEKSLTSWQRFQIRSFWVFVFVIIGYLAWNYRRILLSLLKRIFLSL